MKSWFEGKEILITGGSGTIGKALTEKLSSYNIKGIRIYSRDEFKQSEMKKEMRQKNINCNIAYIIGDVADYNGIELATKGVDIIINAAAMKRIDTCEENPIAALNTNILGGINIIRASIKNKAKQLMHISTDKAVKPANLYGMTKGVIEKAMIHSNIYSVNNPKINCCRYGNVLGSRGSVLYTFKEQKTRKEKLKITDKNMTRFWITIDRAVEFILHCITRDESGKIYFPEMKSASIMSIARQFSSDDPQIIGIRPGEKIHECIVSEEERRNTFFDGSIGIIDINRPGINSFEINSENSMRLSSQEIKEMIEKYV